MKNPAVDDATCLGTVEDVRGATISVALNENTVTGLLFLDGHGYRVGQVGSFVRISIGYIDLFGIVSQVGAGAVPERLAQTEPHGRRWMTVELVGEGNNTGEFQRGLSQYPTIGDIVYLVTEKDLKKIYGRPEKPIYVQIGRLASAESIPTLIDINKLVTRHSAVVGATGAGKSTTVANLLFSLSDKERYASARIVILDIHGEYATALKGRATVFRINANESRNENELCIPYWAMTFDELLAVTTGSLEGKERGAVIEKITELKLESLENTPREGVTKDNLTVDSPVPFSIHKMWFDLHCEVRATYYFGAGQQLTRENWALEKDEKGEIIQPGDIMKAIPPLFRRTKNIKDDPEKIRWGDSTLNIGGAMDSLGSKLRDPRFNFLFNSGSWQPTVEGIPTNDLDSLLKVWIGDDEPITILDLSGIPPSILSNLIGALLRIIYDSLFWARNLPEGGRERPLLFVLEEAHNYLSKGDSGPAALAVKRIVKEGRKYGIGAMIVSQRPSEVDSTVLSQCGTFFAMRLSNTTDRGHVVGATSDNLSGLFDMLPILRTGEMIITGEAVHLPVRTILDPPPKDRRPDSGDPLVCGSNDGPTSAGGWDKKREEDEDYGKVIEVWRKQDPKALREIDKDKDGRSDMERSPVSSSNIASIGYDPRSSTLEVEFNSGGVYQYYDVPEAVYNEFMSASSHGQYLNQIIKGSYRYAKV